MPEPTLEEWWQTVEQAAVWRVEAERLVNEVRDAILADEDAIPLACELVAVLHLWGGEAPEYMRVSAADYAERFAEPEPECTCPTDLVERGGFESTCSLHGGRLGA